MEAHIIITGIISLINMGGGAGYLVLAQDARVPSYSAHDPEAHYATILVERDHVVDDKGLKVREEKGGFVAYDVNNWTIVIENLKEPASLSVDDAHILKIDDAGVGSTAHANRLVGAKLPFQTGTLQATGVENSKAWKFSGTSKGAESYADEVCLEVEVRGPAIVLSFQENEVEVARLVLGAPEGQNIELRFQNVPLEDTIPIGAATTASSGPDHHAAMYFDLMKIRPSRIPHLERSVGNGNFQPPHRHRLSHHKGIPPAKQREVILGPRVGCTPILWDGVTQ